MATLVYELVNPLSHEVFVGLTARDPLQFGALVRAKPPASIAHWPKDALGPVREVETFDNQLDAEKFLPGYIAALHGGTPGWKVYCEDVG